MKQDNSPAFQFYAKDFISGTMHMTTEEVGAYIRLLCFQWEHGSVPNDIKALARITGSRKSVINEVLKKFTSTESGLVNQRLNKSREEQFAYRERQRLNGVKGGRPKTETQNNPVVSVGFQKEEPKPEPKKSSASASSSSNNTNVIYLERDSPDFFTIFKTTYQGRPSLFALTEHKMYTERWLVSQKVNQQEFAKLFDDEFRCKTFSNEKHFQNSISLIIKKIINSKNGNNRQFSKETFGNGAATEAIRSGNVKDFGNLKL